MSIFISAGHHPFKPGASHEGFTEHDEAIRWVDEICNALKENGHLEGTDFFKVPADVLKNKVAFINERYSGKKDVALEIHFNALKVWEDLNKNGVIDDGELRSVGNGCMTLYCPGSVGGLALAKKINTALAAVYSPDLGVREGYYRLDPRNTVDFFLRKTKCPAVILEPDFIHRKGIIQKGRTEACNFIATTLNGCLKDERPS